MYKRMASFSLAGQTQSSGTAIAVGIPPHVGPPGSSPYLYARENSSPNWLKTASIGVTHITNLVITSGSTAHTWYVLRPKNWGYINEAVTINDSTIVCNDNIGTYSTNYRYPLPGSVTATGLAADNSPASGDYVMFQLDSGAWHFSAVSSFSPPTITIATATPNVTGATAAVGRIIFFFGAGGDKDPITGLVDPNAQPAASATISLGNGQDPIFSGLRPGDPLVLVNANATAASTLVAGSGFYGKA